MKLFKYGKDGGPDSVVSGYWLIEIKSLFSIALLCFENGSRDAFHNHAFNSISWVLSGKLEEIHLHTKILKWAGMGSSNISLHHVDIHKPSFWPVITKRDTFHRVSSVGRTWVLTFRGPWKKQWNEFNPATDVYTTLENGRKIVDEFKQEVEL